MGKDEEPEQGFRPRLLALIENGTVALLLSVKAVCCPTFDWYSSEVA